MARRCRRIAASSGLVVVAIGGCALVGWLLHFHPLTTLLPGLVAMKPNTAVALFLGGLSLFFFLRRTSGQKNRWQAASTLLAGLVAAIGALTLFEYAGHVDFGVDELLFRDDTASSVPGRMAPISAFNFVCVGLALVLLRFPRRTSWVHALAGGAAFASLLSIVGFLHGEASLYQSGRFTAVALHTAAGFLLLSAGLWCATSQHGFMRLVTDPGSSGTLLRRYGLAAVTVPFLLGWLRLQCVRHGWCSVEMGVVIVSMLNAATLAGLGWLSANSSRKAERKQAWMQEGLRASEERLHLVFEQLTEGIIIANLEGRILHWNRAALALHGFTESEEGLRRLPECRHLIELADLEGRVLGKEEWPLARLCRGETLQGFEVEFRRLDQGWSRIFSYGGSTVQDATGKPLAFLTLNDITRRKAAETEAGAANEKIRRAHLELETRVKERTAELAAANADLQEQMLERARAEHANQQIMDHSLDVICSFDAEGRFVQISRACETLWGYRPEELIGRRYLDLVHPEDRAKTMAASAVIMQGEPLTEFENCYQHKNGSHVPVAWTACWSREQEIMFCVAHDVTTRREVEAEQQRAREAAEAASRSKSEFLANMSHEIRTPMNGIIGMVELVLDTPLDRSQREYLGMAKSSADTLLGLINDILDFSKIEAGKLELEAIDFDLRHCIGTMLKPLGIRADQKGLELTADIAAEVPYRLVGDPMRLRQILINLTDNAIKFTRRGDVMVGVTIESRAEEACCLHFTVTDTGIGIPAEKQALIFEAFAQADGTTTRTYGGTGLGLAIASCLVGQMHGRIWVESTPGEGTTFHFTARFPEGKMSEASVRPLHPQRLEGLSVLVVDDNAVNRRILKEMLTNWRMKPVLVPSGEEALAEMRRAAHAGAPYPLVILDGMMPEMDGFMAARQIRDNAEISGATVMMLSSAMPTGAAARCAELGVASYLTKPVSQSDLIEAILLAIGSEEAAPAPETAAAPPEELGRSLRILLAEDNPINRALATGILEKRGHTLAHAANGREAVQAATTGTYDLIFMDVQMPEMDGLEATRRIREAQRGTGRQTPIVAMTAHAMTGDRERFLDSGMDDYISKPLQRNELFALLARVAEDRGPAPAPGSPGPDAERPAPVPPAPAVLPPPAARVVLSREEFLAQLDGDEELMQRMIAVFHENTPRLLDDIRAAVARRNAGDVARSTHALLSSLGVVGAVGARRLTLEIAARAEQAEYREMTEGFAALEREVAEVDAALSELCAVPA